MDQILLSFLMFQLHHLARFCQRHATFFHPLSRYFLRSYYCQLPFQDTGDSAGKKTNVPGFMELIFQRCKPDNNLTKKEVVWCLLKMINAIEKNKVRYGTRLEPGGNWMRQQDLKFLNKIVSVGLTLKVTFKQRIEGREAHTQAKCAQEQNISMCQSQKHVASLTEVLFFPEDGELRDCQPRWR